MKKIILEVEINVPEYYINNGEVDSENKAIISNDITQRLSALEVEGQQMKNNYKVLNIKEKE
jgi:hypothetical protein